MGTFGRADWSNEDVGHTHICPRQLASLLYAALAVSTPALGQTPPRMIARLVSRVEPEYPARAKVKAIEGAVRLDALVGKDGHIVKLTVTSGNPLLTGAAKDAVIQWIYAPTLLNGEPIEIITDVCIPFVLSKKSRSPCFNGFTLRR